MFNSNDTSNFLSELSQFSYFFRKIHISTIIHEEHDVTLQHHQWHNFCCQTSHENLLLGKKKTANSCGPNEKGEFAEGGITKSNVTKF